MNKDFFKGEKVGRPKHPLRAEILRLRYQGHTYDAISYFTNVSRQTIATICRRNFLGGRIKTQQSQSQSEL